MAHDGLGRYYRNRNRITLVAMKASELMLGDLLTFKDCLKDGVFTSIKVCELHDYDKDILVSIDGDTSCDLIELDDEIVPIPLTPEILEKNGFINGKFYAESHIEDWQIMSDGRHLAARSERGWCVDIPCTYVHELQHALRLCGTEKEITI